MKVQLPVKVLPNVNSCKEVLGGLGLFQIPYMREFKLGCLYTIWRFFALLWPLWLRSYFKTIQKKKKIKELHLVNFNSSELIEKVSFLLSSKVLQLNSSQNLRPTLNVFEIWYIIIAFSFDLISFELLTFIFSNLFKLIVFQHQNVKVMLFKHFLVWRKMWLSN